MRRGARQRKHPPARTVSLESRAPRVLPPRLVRPRRPAGAASISDAIVFHCNVKSPPACLLAIAEQLLKALCCLLIQQCLRLYAQPVACVLLMLRLRAALVRQQAPTAGERGVGRLLLLLLGGGRRLLLAVAARHVWVAAYVPQGTESGV